MYLAEPCEASAPPESNSSPPSVAPAVWPKLLACLGSENVLGPACQGAKPPCHGRGALA